MTEVPFTPGSRIEIPEFGEGTIVNVDEAREEVEVAVSELETVRMPLSAFLRNG